MDIQEAKEIGESYREKVLGDKWCIFSIEEFSDVFVFNFTTNKYLETGDKNLAPLGNGPLILSKKFKDIREYGSGGFSKLGGFVKTEFKLFKVKEKYQVSRTERFYEISVLRIYNEDKFNKYLASILNHLFIKIGPENEIYGFEIYRNQRMFIEIVKNTKPIKISSITNDGLIKFLYFNLIDPFCEMSFKEVSKDSLKAEKLSVLKTNETIFDKNNLIEKIANKIRGIDNISWNLMEEFDDFIVGEFTLNTDSQQEVFFDDKKLTAYSYSLFFEKISKRILLLNWIPYNSTSIEYYLLIKHHLEVVRAYHNTFDLKKNYAVKIDRVNNEEMLYQYAIITDFTYWGFDDQVTQKETWIFYTNEEIRKVLKSELIFFEKCESLSLLYFLFINLQRNFCEVEIKEKYS